MNFRDALFENEVMKLNFLRKVFEGKEKERKNSLFIVFLVGILLISFIPALTKKSDTTNINEPVVIDNVTGDSYEQKLEIRLENILSNVSGAGEVDVMVSTSKGSELVIAENIESSSNSVSETDANNGNRTTEQLSTKKMPQLLGQNETPLVLTEITPKISGVIIVSEGASNIVVKDSLIRSVATLLEIPTYKVEVLQKK